MSSAAVGTHHHSGAGPLSLMSCVRESSPLQDYELSDNDKHAGTKKKFWNPKKWFKRKNKVNEDAVVPVEIIDRDEMRSRSTSELSISDEHIGRIVGKGPSMLPVLSVSHDSVFHSPNSGSDLELDVAQSSSSIYTSQPQIDLRLQTELSERLRSRRGRGDTSEDDEGLPRSPCNSPTTTDALLDKTAIKDLPTKSHSSDGSLLSMGSFEMEEESSRHSSRLSLHERRPSDQVSDSDLELDAAASTAPLNHSAAHHRVAVRPKRRAPHRNKRVPQSSTALPATPEVNEELSVRSMSPENSTRETAAELYSMSTKTKLTESQLKCSSLPPGLAAPGDAASRLNRSRSNAGSKSHEHFAALEEDVEKEEKGDRSFFDRIFPRRSGKKRKSKEEKPSVVQTYSRQTEMLYRRVESKPIAAPRSGAASRQRVQPIDLSPEVQKREFEIVLPKASPEKSFGGTSPLHAELENRFKQRHTLNAGLTPPQSPKTPPKNFESSVISTVEVSKHLELRRNSKNEETISETKRESRSEESRSNRSEDIKSKMKIPGLSSLQQRVLSLNDEVDDGGFKSLTDLDVKTVKPVTKSHSFKSAKLAGFQPEQIETFEAKNERRISVTKAASLDSVKHLEEPRQLIDPQEIKNEETKVETDEMLVVNDYAGANGIVISGPSHTAVVNVSTSSVDSYNIANTKIETDKKSKEVTTKESVTVTKIQLRKETTQISQSTVAVPKSAVPEFLNRQLNKVETRSSSNIVFSTNSPRIVDEQSRPKFAFAVPPEQPKPRKFSHEDIEIVEKNDEEAEKPTELASQPRFKKNENKRKSSVSSTSPESPKSEKSFRSISLDSLKVETESSDKSSQDSLDKLEEKDPPHSPTKNSSPVESVVLRKKSLIKQKNEEEPELMKVFARRSLKLKDTEGETISQQVSAMLDEAKARDSDKENQADSPKEERKKSKEEENREPLAENAETVERKFVETTEVTLRKPNNNGNGFYARAFSHNQPKTCEETTVKKQASFNERRKTDNWIGGDLIERKISQDEIITGISPKGGFITVELLEETKNFNQRKAEWEKRAQEAQKKSVP